MKTTLIPSATYIVSEIELIYNPKVKASNRKQIQSSTDCYQVFLKEWDTNKIQFVEQFKVLLLSRSSRVLGLYDLSTGGTSATVVDVKLIFTAALKANACILVLAHNHPSGSLKPSNADIAITKKLIAAAGILDIKIMDHIIITSEGYFSFADDGLL